MSDALQPVGTVPELAIDLPGFTNQRGSWLGVDLTSMAALAETRLYGEHVTTGLDADSIARWRRDVPLWVELGEEMRAFGYEG